MAKTIDREKNSAGRARRAARQPQTVEEAEPLNAAPSDEVDAADEADEEFDELDAVDADASDTLAAEDDEAEDDEAEGDESLALAPTDDERIPTHVGSAGVQVPAFLLQNPFTRPLAESYLELRKVTWPSRQDTWNMTIVVIVVSAIMAGLLALADYGLGHLLTWLVSVGLGH